MTVTKKEFIVLAVMLYVAYIVIMPKWGLDGDMGSWMEWSKYMYKNGLVHIYQCGANYMPGFIYFLWINTKIQHTPVNVQDNLYVFKFAVLIFDFIGAYLAVFFIKEMNRKLFAFLFILLNIAWIYNTVVWAQVDSIFSCIGFAAIVAALNRKLILSCMLLVIALNFKIQALVFIPVACLVLFPQYINRFSIVLNMKILAAILITGIIMIFPFLIKGHTREIWNVVTTAVGSYPYISVAAMNFWHLLIPGSIDEHFHILDSQVFLGLTYKSWGLLMFFSAVFIACLPFFIFLYKKLVRKRNIEFPLEKIFLMSALTAASFFYFNTQMHERYFHPALISLAAYTFLSGNYFPFVLGSVAYFLNLERVLNSLALTNYKTLIFHPLFVALLFLVLIIYLFYRLYSNKQFNPQNIQLANE